SSTDEVDDSSIDEVNDSSIDEVDDGTIVKIDSGDIVKVDGNSVSETSSNSADGTDGDFSFNLNVVKKIKKKSFENENEDENMIFFPQKQMGLELDYLNSIFFFFKKFKRYFLLNILLKRRIFNVFSKKNFNNIYLYNFITFFPEDFLFSFYNFDFFSQHPKNFQLLKYTNMSLLNNFVSIKTNTPISETEHRTRVINMYQKICGYNIYVLFFLNLLELKFKKKVFFKIINIYKYFRKHKVYSFYRHIFKKLGYFKFKIRKYFNFHETFKILYMSILFKDATLFMN
ncbi:MAG: hypothetical protein KDH96_06725, partial [Candidatus Riesia sp.]|nr:hypothetical protein [Candidatus Riesia sp.]